MAKTYPTISDDLAAFIAQQPMFFVASAPLHKEGHVNLSPKGLDVFRVLSPSRVAYLDLTGSGNETSAHLAENKRITFMFCAFSGAPNILRLYGRGRTVLPSHADWSSLITHFEPLPGTRQIILADIHRVQTSCGFAVPEMQLLKQRDTLLNWATNKTDEELVQYRQNKNAQSIDGCPAPMSN